MKITAQNTFRILLVFYSLLALESAHSQQVPIANYSIDVNGQVLLEVNSSDSKYYILQVRNHPDSAFVFATSMTLGEMGTTVIRESLKAYPMNYYRVLEYAIDSPFDTDGDGVDDIAEYYAMPFQNPLNAAESINVNNGLVALNTLSAFNDLSIDQNNTPWVPYLNGKEFVKFIIFEFDSAQPHVYFMNSTTHNLHVDFTTALGLNITAPSVVKGQLIYHPSVLASNGTLGTYSFNYSNSEYKNFETVQRTHELIAASMSYLTNNLAYYITENNESNYQNELQLYQKSRVPVLFESDVYAGLDYWGLHQAEGYGFFRLLASGETPNPKDIVLYESLPNSLPHVGGIITSVIQTPLSHVNLRAIGDDIPNAFIRDPLSNDTIANLLNKYIYFSVNQSGYEMREASLDEVNAWYEKNRPSSEQIPPLNLEYVSIFPLSAITFDMYDGFGAKAANVATMRTFGFENGTIPDGFGVPFYFYQEFMHYSHFFEEIEELLKNPEFIADRAIREEKLKTLRLKMELASFPGWMSEALQEMQNSFPKGTSIRCRSSTNNEDLPGFSGAGLYDSKTHHPTEGTIAKSIKQVYASLWNLRAFEERSFYRINHFYTSMGVLCHPNFEGEKVNGVGVSTDPIYSTNDGFYLNAQVGEELITNPGQNVYPEEILLKKDPTGEKQYSVIQYSSLLGGDSLLMTDEQLQRLRYYLEIIHSEFAVLYHAENNATFAMDIEFKIDANNQLVIKQARPWVSYVEEEPNAGPEENCDLFLFPNPANEYVNVRCDPCGFTNLTITDLNGRLMLEKKINQTGSAITHILIPHLPPGVYFLHGYQGSSKHRTQKLIIH